MAESDITELKFKQLNEDLQELKAQVKGLPDIIITRLNDNVDLKLDNAKKDLTMQFFKYIAGAYASIIGLLIGLVISFITGK